jgi:hypothetical protein
MVIFLPIQQGPEGSFSRQGPRAVSKPLHLLGRGPAVFGCIPLISTNWPRNKDEGKFARAHPGEESGRWAALADERRREPCACRAISTVARRLTSCVSRFRLPHLVSVGSLQTPVGNLVVGAAEEHFPPSPAGPLSTPEIRLHAPCHPRSIPTRPIPTGAPLQDCWRLHLFSTSLHHGNSCHSLDTRS